MWHGYFVVQRLNVGAGNWAALVALFEGMGSHGTVFPAYNTHWRASLDGNAVIFESLFDPAEVSLYAFRGLLAAAFGVDVQAITNTTDALDYAGFGTTRWTFYYDELAEGKDRFAVERFAPGGTLRESAAEAYAYLAANAATWLPEVP